MEKVLFIDERIYCENEVSMIKYGEYWEYIIIGKDWKE